jgi:hypothetical protein
MKQAKNPENGKYPKLISGRLDTTQSRPKNQKVKGRRTSSTETKLRSVSKIPDDPLDGLPM